MHKQSIKIFFVFSAILLLFVCALAIRRAVLNAQFSVYGNNLPFTLESALQYRYVKQLFNTGILPEYDSDIQVPDRIHIRKTYEIGAEQVYARVAKLFPCNWPLAKRVRWVSAGFFCLGIPLLSLCLWWWLHSYWAAGIGGAYYAISIASIMRSTGQELSHENFALPLLIAHFALAALAKSSSRRNIFWLAALLSSAFLAYALSAWDLIQYYVLLWAILSFIRFVQGGFFCEERHRILWLINMFFLVTVGMLNPYLHAHAFLTSYAMLLTYGTGLGIIIEYGFLSSGKADKSPKILKSVLALIPLLLGILLLRTYTTVYGHFLDLLLAKLRFLNKKPLDPGLLTFSQRILWIPALNSANFQLTWLMFPAILPLSFLTILIIILNRCWRFQPEIKELVFYCGISLLTFILFVRFHIFLVIFTSLLLGWCSCWALSRRRIIYFCLIPLLLCGIAVEAVNVLYLPERWGNVTPYLKQKKALVRWMRENNEGDAVLANFGLSAFLLAYADCPIILHPKFESPEIRRRVQEYGEALFKSNEANFRNWAERHKACYYVYARGEFSDIHPEWQMRYFVNALHPHSNAAALDFEYHPQGMRFFTYLWGNSKYRVFRIIRSSDELLASQYANEAQEALTKGNLGAAEANATLALMYNPHNKCAIETLLHAGSLRQRGIK